MKAKNLTPFPFGAKVTSRRPPRPEMTLIVRAAYVLSPGRPLSLPEGPALAAQGPMRADTYRDDDDERAGECLYPGDLADWKPRAEVMLRGTCHTPFGKPLPECPVRFAVGRVSKILRVVGRRFWSDDKPGAVMSEPAPFTKMPVDYAHAFGGPGYAANPVGLGFAGRELPNVEHAGHVIRSRRDDPGPAGFGPLNPAWPQRAPKVGKEYGPRWKKERFPWYAADFDWSYFNAAPADQQIDGFLRGDERLVFQNLHPAEQVFETSLPGLRVRVFVKDDKARFREVPMSLDTLFADLDEGKLLLTWRGLDAIETDDMKDVLWALVASERLGEAPLPEAQYRERLEAFAANPLDVKERLPPELAEALDGRGAAAKEQEKKVADALARAAAATTPAAVATAKAQGAANDAARPPSKPKAPSFSLRKKGPPAEEAERREPGPGRDLSGQDYAGRDLRGLDLRAAILKDANLAGALLAGANLAGANLEGAVLSGADLTDADLTGADLTLANLTSACAPRAIFRHATLTRAFLQKADLEGAVFEGAKGELVYLPEVDLTGADCRRLSLFRSFARRAKLAGADLSEASLVRCLFLEADARKAKLRRALLTRTSFGQSDLTGADLAEARGERSVWLGARLHDADFTHAVLPRAQMMEASAVRAQFRRAILKESRCHRASFEQADFTESQLFGIDFSKCALGRARFTGACLYDAKFRQAAGAGCDFTGANLTRAVMEDG